MKIKIHVIVVLTNVAHVSLALHKYVENKKEKTLLNITLVIEFLSLIQNVLESLYNIITF